MTSAYEILASSKHDMLDDLDPSKSISSAIVVKVDRVYPKSDINLFDRICGWPKKVASLDFIVFDSKLSRMTISLIGDDIIDRFSNRLEEKSTYFIHRFNVAVGGFDIHSRFHIEFFPDTCIHVFPCPMVDYVFKIRPVEEIRREWWPVNRVRDVCGFLRAVGGLLWDRYHGLLTWKFSFIVEDIHGKMISCLLYGDVAKDAWKDFVMHKGKVNLIVAVQYGLVRSDQGYCFLTNFSSATMIFWDPKFKELADIRNALLQRRMSESGV
ncbi:uncharacterized protein LOC129295336 [Prosopis cineraria]|uniref:uncharacterized protein LOC129295336 n=1 Tax=Prosopis cineraria TaxID=364024 RepID=UPI00240F52C1|nr:uncharacterized protein LOC129295336 [Prosopis cineraria]XP_054789829.1 uncharacterized protein LOC129295336 [Prosopis cineraria]